MWLTTSKQFSQLRDIRRDPLRLVARQQLLEGLGQILSDDYAEPLKLPAFRRTARLRLTAGLVFLVAH